ncbi:YybH family protein [Microvirga puerhi]|uniref:Nuclear transport factor 2 family protein n=1 Tax=Microvirga puerhi TaxID=2876078 RepID=A0ABS7VM62_9HYPH|nr:nuclear transport factor 2 family protein [Microvirga puerhi]MBZ6076077.1 nuclear transport factor 2 family protein [Microvirga puerhi]
MDTTVHGLKPENEVRRAIEGWLGAVRAGDIDGIAAHYAPDILAFDAVSQLQFKGREAYMQHWRHCFDLCGGPHVFELRDIGIAAGDDVAFAHFLNRCGGIDENGKEQTSWMRATIGYRKIGGRWMVVHEHFSAPFDMENFKALFDLEP